MRVSIRQRGFTLVEVLIVVIILGVLAAIVVPQFVSASEETRQQAFVSNLRAFRDVIGVYIQREGVYPEDSSSGVLPSGFEEYMKRRDWESGTPIGGVWDVENNDNGVSLAVGVHFDGTGQTQDDAYMNEVDAIFDDGDVTTGSFQRLAGGRYYYIIEF